MVRMTKDQNLISPPYGGNVGQPSPRPWEKAGMARSSWYRQGKPTSKPSHQTQEDIARQAAVSVRRLQRASRVRRLAPQLVPFVRAGLLKTGTAEKYLGHEDRLAVLLCDLQEKVAHKISADIAA